MPSRSSLCFFLMAWMLRYREFSTRARLSGTGAALRAGTGSRATMALRRCRITLSSVALVRRVELVAREEIQIHDAALRRRQGLRNRDIGPNALHPRRAEIGHHLGVVEAPPPHLGLDRDRRAAADEDVATGHGDHEGQRRPEGRVH